MERRVKRGWMESEERAEGGRREGGGRVKRGWWEGEERGEEE